MADDTMRRRREIVARAFTERRAELQLTQQQVAERADIAVKSVYNFEVKGLWPNAKTRARLERAVGWPEGEIERRGGASQSPLSPELERRIKALPDETREYLIQVLTALREERRHRAPL